jgi:hypothetical protein
MLAKLRRRVEFFCLRACAKRDWRVFRHGDVHLSLFKDLIRCVYRKPNPERQIFADKPGTIVEYAMPVFCADRERGCVSVNPARKNSEYY